MEPRKRNRRFLFCFLLLVLLGGGVRVSAQVPVTQGGVLVASNDYIPVISTTNSLSLNVGPGEVVCLGTVVTYSGGAFTLTASASNYIFLDPTNSCAPTINITGFPAAGVPIALVITNASFATVASDMRAVFWAAGSSGGGSPGGASTAVQFNNSGAFGGDATNLFYNSTSHLLSVTGGVNIPSSAFWNGATGSDAALKFNPNFGDQYVDAATGNDANDGQFGSPVKDITQAWKNIPGGIACQFIACGGTIFISGNVTWGGPTNQGLQIMGPADPNWNGGNVPAGWLEQKSVNIVCMGGGSYDSGIAATQCTVTGNDAGHAGIWLSGTNAPMEFEGLKIAQGTHAILTGMNSNGVFSSSTSGSQSLTFRRDSFGVSGFSTDGPAVLLGPNTFEIYFYDCVWDANNAATGGTENRQGMSLDPEGFPSNTVGLVTVVNSHSNGGAIEVGGGNINVDGLITEGQSDGKGAIWFTSAADPSAQFNTINNVEVSDPTVATPAIENDSGVGIIAMSVKTANGPTVVGNAIVLGIYPESLQTQTASFLRSGQTGFVGGWEFGKRENIQRQGGPTAVRFQNQVVGTSCSSWITTPAGGTLTCGIADPFGGTNAGQASVASGTISLRFTPGSSGDDVINLPVNSYVIGGFWSRSQTANGYSGSYYTPAAMSIFGTGVTASGGCDGDSVLGDGEWVWNRCIYQITAAGSGQQLVFGANFDNTHTLQAYGPVLIFVPAGTLSNNEVYNLLDSLNTYDTTCAVGNVCGLPFASLQFPSFTSMAANPAHSGVLRLATGDTLAWRNNANSADIALGKNISDQLTFGGNIVPAFTGTWTLGDCAGLTATTGIMQSVACGSGGSGFSGMTAGQIPVASSATGGTSSLPLAGGGTQIMEGTLTGVTNGIDLLGFNGAGVLVNETPGIPPNPQSGTYTLATTDRGATLIFPIAASAAATWTLPAAGSTGFASNWYVDIQNNNASFAVTLSSTSTIDYGAGLSGTSMTIGAGQFCEIRTQSVASTGTYSALCTFGGGGTVTYTASQTASSSDNGKLVILNCSAACSYTLPATQPSTTWTAHVVTIGSTNATIALGGSDTFNGATAVPAMLKFRPLYVNANSATATDYEGEAPLVPGTNITFTAASNGLTVSAPTMAQTAVQVSAATNFGLPISAAQTIIASVACPGGAAACMVFAQARAVQTSLGVGCTTANNTVKQSYSITGPGGTTQTLSNADTLTISGNGTVDTGAANNGTGGNELSPISFLVENGTSITYTTTSTLASTCTTAPQYTEYARVVY